MRHAWASARARVRGGKQAHLNKHQALSRTLCSCALGHRHAGYRRGAAATPCSIRSRGIIASAGGRTAWWEKYGLSVGAGVGSGGGLRAAALHRRSWRTTRRLLS